MNNHNPTLDQLKRGLAIAEQIAALESTLAAIFNGSATPTAKAAPAKGTFKRSPETIAKMKAAQQARWAKIKGKKAQVASKAPAKTPVVSKAPARAKAEAPVKKKRTISAAVKAKLAAAMKKRWADAKAGKGPAPTASKKA